MENIRNAMEARGMTAEQLAQATGMSARKLQNKLDKNCTGAWKLHEAVAVCKALNSQAELSFHEILDLKDSFQRYTVDMLFFNNRESAPSR